MIESLTFEKVKLCIKILYTFSTYFFHVRLLPVVIVAPIMDYITCIYITCDSDIIT